MNNALNASMLFLLDMDGTIYNENKLFASARELLTLIKQRGGRYIFVTNNSSRSVSAYVEKLKKMGIEASEDDFYTSSQATAAYLKQNCPEKRIYCVGTRSFKDELISKGLNVAESSPDEAQLVLVGYDTELTYEKLYTASKLLFGGADYVAANPDWGCPAPFGLVPDCGAICEALYMATKRRPRFIIGKPEPEMILSAVKMTGRTLDETVVVGDRLYTDIAAGNNAGVKSVLVFSGETTPEMLAASEIKPFMALKDIGELYELLK